MKDKLFKTGQVVMTNGIQHMLNTETLVPKLHVDTIMKRHTTGDWGDVDDEDKQTNNDALKHGSRLISSYNVADTKVWIITEADRSVTTILLPSEY